MLTNNLTQNYETPEYFSQRGWWTPAQIRDFAIEAAAAGVKIIGEKSTGESLLTTELVQKLKVLALNEQARRKSSPDLYCECVRCKGYHEQLQNIDRLCEKCEAATAPMRYDAAHPPTR